MPSHCSSPSWLTAAIPMDNPYCSCKLTRVPTAAGPLTLTAADLTDPLDPTVKTRFVYEVRARWPYSCNPYGESLLQL